MNNKVQTRLRETCFGVDVNRVLEAGLLLTASPFRSDVHVIQNISPPLFLNFPVSLINDHLYTKN